MSLSKVSKDGLRGMISQALRKVSTEGDFELMTDFHLHLRQDTGELTMTDDEGALLGSIVVEEWNDVNSDVLNAVAHALTSLLQQMHHDKEFDGVKVLKPFSFVLEDDDKETVEDLFVVDDDNICLTDSLLKGMDEDLDSFFSKLMKE